MRSLADHNQSVIANRDMDPPDEEWDDTEYELTDERREALIAAQEAYDSTVAAMPTREPLTLAEFIDGLPEGDFKNDGEASEWHVYNCGSNDCEQRWHLIAYALDVQRVNGKLVVEVRDCDDAGNHDFVYSYDEREHERSEEYWADVGLHIATMSDDYFKGWGAYWLHVAEMGIDPCDQILSEPDDLFKFALDAVKDNLTYLAPPTVDNEA